MHICLEHGKFLVTVNGQESVSKFIADCDDVVFRYDGAILMCPVCKVPQFVTSPHAICSKVKNVEANFNWDDLMEAPENG